jgi:hypothetical protein
MDNAELIVHLGERSPSFLKSPKELHLLIKRIPQGRHHDFLAFCEAKKEPIREFVHLAEAIREFNESIVATGDLNEVIGDLESKIARCIPALLARGFLTPASPALTWAPIQGNYRLVIGKEMLLVDFTPTEFRAVQALKFDRAVRMIHRDAGEFMPYALALLKEERP